MDNYETNDSVVEFPVWLIQNYLGDDDEGNPIIWIADTRTYWAGDDDAGSPLFVEVP